MIKIKKIQSMFGWVPAAVNAIILLTHPPSITKLSARERRNERLERKIRENIAKESEK
jgi:hypothetical protein